MDFRRRRQRRRTQKKKKHGRKTRHRRHVSKPPNALINFSPVSSPGPNSPTLSLSPNSSPNTPITKRAKILASLYPNRQTMLQRSQSFNNTGGMTTENFYREFERVFPEGNGPAYP